MRSIRIRYPEKYGAFLVDRLQKRSLSARNIIVPVRVSRSPLRIITTFYARCTWRMDQRELELQYRLRLPILATACLLVILSSCLFLNALQLANVLLSRKTQLPFLLAFDALTALFAAVLCWQYRECQTKFRAELDALVRQADAGSIVDPGTVP